MPDDSDRLSRGVDQCNNPYDDEAHPDAYRAYRKGWEARHSDKPHTANPYETDERTTHRAWLNGWQAAHLHSTQASSSP